MHLPRPHLSGRRASIALTLLVLVAASPYGSASAVDLRAGNLLITDRTADPLGFGDSRGILCLGDEASPIAIRVIASPRGFVDPQTAIALGDGRILVVDANADPFAAGEQQGALYVVDPQDALPGRVVLYASSPYWDNPTDLLLEPSGEVLMLDPDADPNHFGGHPGALFRVSGDRHTVSIVATSPSWVDPRSMVWDRDGTVLVWDTRADPLGLGGFPGALFRVDPRTGSVVPVFSARGFTTPWAIALASNGDYLILDRDANPNGYPGAPGALFRVNRNDLSVTTFASSPDWVDPFDIAVAPNGDIWVADQRANPYNYPDENGAVYRLSPADGSIKKVISAGFFRAVIGVSVVAGSALDSSTVTWNDLNGAPVQPGDRMRVRVRIRNTGTTPGNPVRMEHDIGGDWDYSIGSDSSSAESFSYDPSTRIVRWVGNIDIQGEETVSYEIRLHNGVASGTPLHERVSLRVQRTGIDFTLEGAVARPSLPGRVVWADYEPIPGGATQGVLWEMRQGFVRPQRVFSGPPLVKPGDLVFLPDGRMAVLDQRATPRGEGATTGGIFAIDPLSGSVDTLMAFADYPDLRVPLGLASGDPDELIITDKDANPLGLPGRPGAVYSFDMKTKSLVLIASSPQFSEPSDAILESTGKILMADYDADPSGQNPHGGAIFEIDRSSGDVQWIHVPQGTFSDPVGLAEGTGRRIFVADLSADPLHLNQNTGAIFEIHRLDNNSVQVTSADARYVDPTDIYQQRDGSLIVTDRDANPLNLPPRDFGAIFKVPSQGGAPTLVTADGSLYGPEAVAGYEEGSLAFSHLTFTDLNGFPATAGDTLRYEATLRNSGRRDIPDAMATVILSPGQDLIRAQGPGGVRLDLPIRAVVWSGRVGLTDTIHVQVDARVSAGHSFGDRMNGVLYISGPGSPPPDSVLVSVAAALGSGDLVLVDKAADPNHIGRPHGALFEVRTNATKLRQLLQTDTLWTGPNAIEGFDQGRMLVAETNNQNPGSILIADYLHSTSTPYITDPRLGDPSDLLWTRSGDLLVVDPRAHIDAAPYRPTLFVQRAGQSGLSILCADTTLLRTPTQITEDETGRLWLLDRYAHPDTSIGGQGAIFGIDPATGAVIDTLEFPQLAGPTGIVTWTGEGLIIVDGRAGPNERGVLFQVDPDARTIRGRVSDSRFSEPLRAAFTPGGELWIIDRLARDDTQNGSPHTMFRWDPETNAVEMGGSSPDYVYPSDLYIFPGANPRIVSYTVQDLNGPPLATGDEIVVRASVTNIGPIPTLGAAYVDTLSGALIIDRASVQADAGVVQSPESGNAIFWDLDLDPGTIHQVSYHATLRPTLPQGLILNFRSHLRSVEGVHRVRQVTERMPVLFEDGFVYVTDPDADPYNLGSLHGALFKIDLNSAQTTTMGSTTALLKPISALSMPTTDPNVLVIDRDANPLNHSGTRGCVWRWVPETGDFTLAAADPRFRSPRAAVVLNDREILLLDGVANATGGAHGRGTVFLVDVSSGQVAPFASDTLFTTPSSICLDGRGGAFIIDADADPGHFGLHNGAVFRLDLLQRTISLYAFSADFRGPISGTVGPDGALYVVDRDVTPIPNSQARGAIFRVDANGNVVRNATSSLFRSPYDVKFDTQGRMLVSDLEADPYRVGGNRGTIFRRDRGHNDFNTWATGIRYSSPSGFFVKETSTPIDLSEFAAAPLEEGIRLTWQVQEATFDGFIILRASGIDPEESDFAALNPDHPIPGRGPWQYDDLTVTPGETYTYRVACLMPGGGEEVFGPAVATAPLLRPFALLPAAPNPTRGTSTLRFDLPHAGTAVLKIYDVSGRLVRSLVDGPLPAGRHEQVWDGRNNAGNTVASGIYLLKLDWNGRHARRRLALLR